MGWAARLRASIVLLAAAAAFGAGQQALGVEKDRLVPAGRLVIEGKRLSCGGTQTLLRDFKLCRVLHGDHAEYAGAERPAPPGAVADLLPTNAAYPVRPERDRCGLLRNQTRQARRLAERADAQRYLRRVQHSRPLSVHQDPESRCNQLSQCLVKKGVTARGER